MLRTARLLLAPVEEMDVSVYVLRARLGCLSEMLNPPVIEANIPNSGAVACVQVSMNFNTSVFPNAVQPLSKAFNIGEQEARTGQMIYLVTYSIGCELWAPWSEEFGRWPILQLSMFLINIWQIPAALAPNWGTIVVARGLVSRLPERLTRLIDVLTKCRVVSLPPVVASLLV